MKEKLKDILKKFSFMTNKPVTDWQRLFSLLIVAGLCSLAWNVYFFFSIRADIVASEFVTKTRNAVMTTKEDEIKGVIQIFEDKKVKQAKYVEAGSVKLEDPSVL